MRFYFYKTPGWLKMLYPDFTWRKENQYQKIYLTFDDGPVPEATPEVLEILDRFGVKASFFVVGDNVRKFPDLLKEVKNQGHTIGNHTFHHVSGWKMSITDYLNDIDLCSQYIHETIGETTTLFRPPYGRSTYSQAKKVTQQYEVIMWEILSGDFDRNLNFQSSFAQLKKSIPGDILVFHDNRKYIGNVKKLLPDVISYLQDQGFGFEKL